MKTLLFLAPGNLNIELIDTDKRVGIINRVDNL